MWSMKLHVPPMLAVVLLSVIAMPAVADATPVQTTACQLAPVAGPTSEVEAQCSVEVPYRGCLPLPALSIDPWLVCTGQLVWLDATGSYDLDGRVVRYHWDPYRSGVRHEDDILECFPLAASVPRIPLLYDSEGVYAVRVCVEDDDGNRAISDPRLLLVVDRPPSADLEASPVSTETGGLVTLNAAASEDQDGRIVRYSWDPYGVGSFPLVTTGPRLPFLYPCDGAFAARVCVEDDHGNRSISDSVLIDVRNRPPSVRLAATATDYDTGEVSDSDGYSFATRTLTDVTFDASSSCDVDGRIVWYRWDLDGDGAFQLQTASSKVAWRYEANGEYRVRVLDVDDDNGQATAELTVVVRNRLPLPVLEVQPPESFRGETVTFDACCSEDPDGVIVSYLWDLDGDGSHEAQTSSCRVTRSYAVTGDFSVSVNAVDDDGEAGTSVTETVKIGNHLPAAEICAVSENPTDGADVRFGACGVDEDGSVEGWEWSFGHDSESSSVQSPSHRYPDDGRYTVTLRVRDNDGAWSSPDTIEILVTNACPVAELRVSTRTAKVGEMVRFTDLSRDPSVAGQVIHMGLDFGDGQWATGGAVYDRQYDHSYAAPGAYEVTLYVIDDDGRRVSTSITVTVQ